MANDHAAPSAFVLLGATGDLARRMLWPSLYNLHADGLLPEGRTLFAAARAEMALSEFRQMVVDALETFLPAGRLDSGQLETFLARCTYEKVDAGSVADFKRLAKSLGARREGATYYLATSPAIYGQICASLAEAGLAAGARAIVLEKPIGRDLESSRVINEGVAAAFDESRIFRIDHYLGKETVQNLLALRFGNVLFEPLWNAHWIEHVQITISETVGVEGRWSYYDESGALRDMVQNHLLQLLCLVAMEPPAGLDPGSVRNEKIKVLRSLRPIEGADVAQKTVAGQYTAGVANGQSAPGYADEAGGSRSRTETFVAIRADIDNWRWQGVPFFLRTGKRLPERRTEIIIRFKPLPHNIFGASAGVEQQVLRIRLQPQETVELTVMTKEPGLEGMKIEPVALDLSLTEAFKQYRRRIAYERLILDAMNGQSTLFVRRDEVEAAWSWIDRISKGWAESRDPPKPYVSGTWGPSAAVALIERAGFSWAD